MVRTSAWRLVQRAAACAALAAACCASAAPPPADGVHVTGTLAGAAYRIDVPARWNHRLVVFYHGTAPGPVTFAPRAPPSPMFDPLLAQGYAVIQSGYSEGGWAIEAGARDTERLRQWFVARYGAPAQTLLVGMSMGGALIAHAMETQPRVYAGALSLCGALQPSDALLNQGFALRAAFDFHFPGVLGPLAPVPADWKPDAAAQAKVAAALASNPAATRELLRWYGAADAQNLAAIIVAATSNAQQLQQRLGANPLGNADLVYVGSGDDAALNDGVRRYRADPRAAAWLARWYTPDGRLAHPLLDLHDTRDPLVPASGVFEYALRVRRAGDARNFVQQYVNREGHCVFTPEEVGRAFNELVRWVDAGQRPARGRLP